MAKKAVVGRVGRLIKAFFIGLYFFNSLIITTFDM